MLKTVVCVEKNGKLYPITEEQTKVVINQCQAQRAHAVAAGMGIKIAIKNEEEIKAAYDQLIADLD